MAIPGMVGCPADRQTLVDHSANKMQIQLGHITASVFPKNHCRKGNSEEWGGRGEVGVEGEARTINIGVDKHTGL